MIYDFDASSESISFLCIIFSLELQTYCLVNSDFEHRNFCVFNRYFSPQFHQFHHESSPKG